MYWDDAEKTWVDSKTGKPIPGRFSGKLTKKPCPPPTATTTPSPTTPKTNDGVKTASAPARFELGLGYSYMHADDEVVQNLNGFNVSGFYNVTPWFAVGGEFSGLYGTETQQFKGNATTFDENTALDRYLYLLGPQVTVHLCERTRVYGHVLVGGVHDENKINFMSDTWRSSADAFAMAVGVGVDVRVTRRFSVGPSFDYVPTHFSSSTGNDWQNYWRAGVTVKFSF
jgi:opacity protein-like surface antigen